MIIYGTIYFWQICKIFRQNCISFANFVIKIKHISTEFVKDLLLKCLMSFNPDKTEIMLFSYTDVRYNFNFSFNEP